MITVLKAGGRAYDDTLVKKLGQGSSGFVWVAKADNSGEEAVLKFVPLVGWRKEEFERELRAFKTLQHPNILRLHKNYIQGTEGVLVIERLDRDLLDFLDGFQISEAEGKLIFKQILRGIDHLHSNNCAHMDIKPENILIRGSDQIKIADLGSTFFWHEKEGPLKTGKAGTSFYCAPEVKDSTTPYLADKADIWSLGITLHVILTGFWPYLGQSEKEVLANAKCGRVDLASQLLSSGVIEFLNLMLQLEPTERPSVKELLSHPWFADAEENLIFTPRGQNNPIEIHIPNEPSETEESAEEDYSTLSDLTEEGFKTPRKCQMFSPRAAVEQIKGLPDIARMDDNLLIRPSPRVTPIQVNKDTKQTKIRKFLLNFRKVLDKPKK